MKKKNKKLMLLVSVLLLSVGIAFAYYASSTNSGGEGIKTEATTTIVGDAIITTDGSIEFSDLNILPGHKNVSSIKINARGNGEVVPYNLVWTGTNNLNTPLNYEVYKSTDKIETNVTCERKSEAMGGAYIIYEECVISNQSELGSAIASGSIASSSEEIEIKLVGDEEITATTAGTDVYYYVVLEYPNLDESQNSDIGGSFSGEVKVQKISPNSDFNILAAYVKNEESGEYEETEDIPTSGYVLNTTKSNCTNGATLGWNNNSLIVSNLSKSDTSCYLYFDKSSDDSGSGSTSGAGTEMILADKTILTRSNFSVTYMADVANTLYSASDNDGTSYYYAGASTENYVRFAGFWWRIIRINGDGSIRIIYEGITGRENGVSDANTQISTSAFNSSYNNNMYVGYMYKSSSVHGVTTGSIIKGVLETWYTNNIQTNFGDYIDINAGFCNDRQPSTVNSSLNGSGGTGTTTTYYGAYIRLYKSGSEANAAPSFECVNSSDLFTATGASKGNAKLSKPIGLITADEVAFAGGVYGVNNSSYYLYTGQDYWTMSPYGFNGDASVFVVLASGYLDYYYAASDFGVRPVLNLKASTIFKAGGTGTKSNPYVVI